MSSIIEMFRSLSSFHHQMDDEVYKRMTLIDRLLLFVSHKEGLKDLTILFFSMICF